MSSVVHYIQSIGMVHRDIKLENIMMSDKTNTAHVKLVDFGLAKIIGPECLMREPFGTVGYCAPEILLGQSYSLSCDQWSLGCLIYAMVCESLPFDNVDERQTIKSTIKDQLAFDSPQWKDFPPQGMRLIEKLLCKDPERRISIDKVLDDPWFFKLKNLSKIHVGPRSSRNASIGGPRFATQRKMKVLS